MSTIGTESTLRRLEASLAEICGHLNVLHEQMVTVTREALETEAWHGHGIRSAEHWLAWQTGPSPERAKSIVEIAGRQVELPVTFGAFADGLLSVDQVAAVVKRTPVHNDREACELAQNATVGQLRSALSKHFFPPVPKPDTPQPAPEPVPEHGVRAGFDDDGEFFLHGTADGADGALVLKALQEAKDALFRAGHTDVTWLDALLEVSRRSLGAATSPSRRDMYKVIVHLDSEGGWLHQGPPVPDNLRDRVCCDGIVQPLWTRDGSPVNMGRSRHIVPLRTRIVVENRDRICRHPTCHSSIGLEIHHIVHWANRGSTDTENLCCLCERHHTGHHRGEFTIEGDANQPGGLVFRDRHGHVIQPCGQPKPPGDTPPPEPAKPYQHPTGERLQLKWLDFTPPPEQPPPDSNN